MIITIEDVPVSQNVSQNWHWAKKSRYKKKWENYVIPYGFIWKSRHNHYAKTVNILICFNDNRRRDKDNYCYQKGIMDGLVKAGIIKDDSVKNVKMDCNIKLKAKARITLIEIGGVNCY